MKQYNDREGKMLPNSHCEIWQIISILCSRHSYVLRILHIFHSEKTLERETMLIHWGGRCLSSKLSSSGFKSHLAFNIILRNGELELRTDEDLDLVSFFVWKSCLCKICDLKRMFRMSVCMPFSLDKRAAALLLTKL